MRLLIIILSLSFISAEAQRQTYRIILKTSSLPGDINYKQIKKLKEPLKALTALYSAMGGSYCSDSTCDLTTALGLGNQGSMAHIELIKKYLPNRQSCKCCYCSTMLFTAKWSFYIFRV